MKFLTNSLGALLAALFVISAVLALIFFNIEQRMFDVTVYQQVLQQEQVYERLPVVIAEALSASAQREGQTGILALMKNLSVPEWQVIVTNLLPAEEMQKLVEETLLQIMSYANGESEVAVLSLGSFKTYLQSPAGIDAIYALIQAQPDCTLDQLALMALGSVDLALCNPPDQFLGIDLRPVIDVEIRAAISTLPEQIILLSHQGDPSSRQLDLQMVRMFMRISPLVPLVILLLITILVVRSFKGWLQWWGIPLLVAGGAGILVSLVSAPVYSLFFRLFIQRNLPVQVPPNILELIRDVTRAVFAAILWPVTLEAGLIALVGLVMVAISVFIPGKPKGLTAVPPRSY